MSKLKIAIADHHVIFRIGLNKVLSEISFVGEIRHVCSGKELLELVEAELPDIVICDLDLPLIDGPQCMERIYKRYPEVRMIMTSVVWTPRLVSRLASFNCSGFLLKSVDEEEIRLAISAVSSSGIYANQFYSLKNRTIQYDRKLFIKTTANLTAREKEIVKLLYLEYSRSEIGDILSLSENTVRNHKARIMKKLELKSSAGLIRYVMESGLLEESVAVEVA